jgi:hypothetical protein
VVGTNAHGPVLLLALEHEGSEGLLNVIELGLVVRGVLVVDLFERLPASAIGKHHVRAIANCARRAWYCGLRINHHGFLVRCLFEWHVRQADVYKHSR